MGLDLDDSRARHGIWSNVSLTHERSGQDRRSASDHHAAAAGHIAVPTLRSRRPCATLTPSLSPATLRADFGDIERRDAGDDRCCVEQGSRVFASNTCRRCTSRNPKLWWPVGYGEPNLYPVSISFVVDGAVSDRPHSTSGVRQFTYSEDGGVLKIWINGRRLIARGGNWGFPESMLRYRSREYDAALRYHRDEHFNMIRNWVGQTGDEAFYDAADRYGVVVWQDFWLANPWDGPDPG